MCLHGQSLEYGLVLDGLDVIDGQTHQEVHDEDGHEHQERHKHDVGDLRVLEDGMAENRQVTLQFQDNVSLKSRITTRSISTIKRKGFTVRFTHWKGLFNVVEY